MAAGKCPSSMWIVMVLLLSSFQDGECQGSNNRGCQCGETGFSGTSGTVTSPYYPQNYRNRCNCRYTITVTNPNRIRLQFHSLDFGGNTCQQDTVRVYDGQVDLFGFAGFFCSNRETPATFISQTRRMVIWFRSDSRTVARGFRATYSIISPTTDAPTTHSTTLPTTYPTPSTKRVTTPSTTSVTTPSTTSVTTPSMTSTEKSTLTSTSTFPPTTTRAFTVHVTTSEGPPDISPTLSTSVTLKKINERIGTGQTNVSTTAQPTLPTIARDAQARSSFLTYVWILPIIIVVSFIVIAAFLVCYLKRRRTDKTSGVNGNRGKIADSIPPEVLAADGTTVIVNQTYQSSDDFIADTVYQPVEDNVVNAETVKNSKRGAIESKSKPDFQTSPIYQTTNISGSDPEATAYNYDLVNGEKDPSGDAYQTAGDSVYKYSDIDKSDYQYAESTSPYDYADAATLPISARRNAKRSIPETYEALNPINVGTIGSVGLYKGSGITENVAYASSDLPQSSQYMGLEEATPKPYQELMTTGNGFVENAEYSGIETEEGYLYPDVAIMSGKGFSNETGYDQVHVGAYASVDENNKDRSPLNSLEKSGTLPNSDAYDVVNVNSEGASTKNQSSGRSKDDSGDVMNSETYETLTYRDPAEVNISYNETGYIDYKANANASYQPLKPNANSLFAPKPRRR